MNDDNNGLKTSREAALASGDTCYLGPLCVRGHSGVRYASTGKCTPCKQLRNAGHVPPGGGQKQRAHGEPTTLDWIKENCVENAATGCWIWQRAHTRKGYGTIRHQGRQQLLHRVAFELGGGFIPPGLLAMHSCDTPACCNPEHLSAGTHLDNALDKMSKGRGASGTLPGEANGRAKLSELNVIAIKAQLATGRSQADIAAEFGVSNAAISLIRSGKNWAHLNPTSTTSFATA